ncbi:DUF1405 domain-containing protein [Xylanibacillus composti]|nr:DUF1405 domain-containing protein [Xylanibacillus composti]
MRFWRKEWLLNPRSLLLLILINGGGTIYGYIWYSKQLAEVAANKPVWYLPFVPDSPTASLFLTLALIGLLWWPPAVRTSASGAVWAFIEAFAVVTLFKYGIWAVTMIVAGGLQGDILNWQHYMLIVSHLGMVVEALLYARYFTYRWPSLLLVTIWSLWNDGMDYIAGIFPYLPRVLHDDLTAIGWFTVLLGLAGVATAAVLKWRSPTVKSGK